MSSCAVWKISDVMVVSRRLLKMGIFHGKLGGGSLFLLLTSYCAVSAIIIHHSQFVSVAGWLGTLNIGVR